MTCNGSCCGYPLTEDGKCLVSGEHRGLQLTEDETKELTKFFEREYLNPNTFPALTRLIHRMYAVSR